jgi:hypothetical protein
MGVNDNSARAFTGKHPGFRTRRDLPNPFVIWAVPIPGVNNTSRASNQDRLELGTALRLPPIVLFLRAYQEFQQSDQGWVMGDYALQFWHSLFQIRRMTGWTQE